MPVMSVRQARKILFKGHPEYEVFSDQEVFRALAEVVRDRLAHGEKLPGAFLDCMDSWLPGWREPA